MIVPNHRQKPEVSHLRIPDGFLCASVVVLPVFSGLSALLRRYLQWNRRGVIFRRVGVLVLAE